MKASSQIQNKASENKNITNKYSNVIIESNE